MTAAMITILVTSKQNYGATQFYPANEAAHALADIAGTKTPQPRTLIDAGRMGCKVMLSGATMAADMLRSAGVPFTIQQAAE